MKLTFVLIYNNKDDNYSVTIINKVRKDTSKKDFYHEIRRKYKNGITGKNNKNVYLVWSILLCRDIESNPGPWREQNFRTQRGRLYKHLATATEASCDDCEQNVCNEARLNQHQRTAHVGHGISARQSYDIGHLDPPIFADTGHLHRAEYQAVMDEHHTNIRTYRNTGQDWKTINKQLLSLAQGSQNVVRC